MVNGIGCSNEDRVSDAIHGMDSFHSSMYKIRSQAKRQQVERRGLKRETKRFELTPDNIRYSHPLCNKLSVSSPEYNVQSVYNLLFLALKSGNS